MVMSFLLCMQAARMNNKKSRKQRVRRKDAQNAQLPATAQTSAVAEPLVFIVLIEVRITAPRFLF